MSPIVMYLLLATPQKLSFKDNSSTTRSQVKINNTDVLLLGWTNKSIQYKTVSNHVNINSLVSIYDNSTECEWKTLQLVMNKVVRFAVFAVHRLINFGVTYRQFVFDYYYRVIVVQG